MDPSVDAEVSITFDRAAMPELEASSLLGYFLSLPLGCCPLVATVSTGKFLKADKYHQNTKTHSATHRSLEALLGREISFRS